MQIRTMLCLLIIFSINLAACGSTGSNGQSAAQAPNNKKTELPKQGIPAESTKNPPHQQNSNEDTKAKESFSKTFAFGTKKWNFQDTNVSIRRSKILDGQVLENLILKCSSKSPVTLKGLYPNVWFEMSSLACDQEQNPHGLTVLQLISRKINYRARHNPVSTSEPIQFSLQVIDYAGEPFFPLMPKSLNALTREDVVFMDFLGKQTSQLTYETESAYFLEISLKQNKDELPEKLIMSLTITDSLTKELTEVSIDADLSREK